MKDYRNMTCAACDVVFSEDSDIVVCPVCGAPHHRACWQETGHCACESMHSGDYEWQPSRIVIGGASASGRSGETGTAPAENPTVTCPRCGGQTPSGQVFCDKCGYYIEKNPKDAFSDPDEEAEDLSDRLEKMLDYDPGEIIDGVPAGDIRRFVGNMWVYYIPRFLRITRNRIPLSFNFSALLMRGLWFVFRRMYLTGVLLVLLELGMAAGRFYLAMRMNDFPQTAVTPYSLGYLALTGLDVLLMAFCGLFGNRIYLKFCTRRVRQINREATERNADADEFNESVESGGGVAMLPVLSVGLCYVAVLYALQNGFFF